MRQIYQQGKKQGQGQPPTKDSDMPFINEVISKEDREKYGIDDIDKRWIVGGTRSRGWTVNKEVDAYLRNVANGRPDTGHWSQWNFYWRGHLFNFEIDKEVKERGEGWKNVFIRVKFFFVPPHLQPYKEVILKSLSEAFQTYKDGGIFATDIDYQLSVSIEDDRRPESKARCY